LTETPLTPPCTVGCSELVTFIKKTRAKTIILHCLNAIFKSQNALNSKFSGAPPRTPLGSLQRSPRPPSWWGGGSLLPPKDPSPALEPRASALWASHSADPPCGNLTNTALNQIIG